MTNALTEKLSKMNIDELADIVGRTMSDSKTYNCTDGHVTKQIEAASPREAAEAYAIVSCEVIVTEVDREGRPVGKSERIAVEI